MSSFNFEAKTAGVDSATDIYHRGYSSIIATKAKQLLKKLKFGKNQVVQEKVKVSEVGRAVELTAHSPGGVLCKAADPCCRDPSL